MIFIILIILSILLFYKEEIQTFLDCIIFWYIYQRMYSQVITWIKNNAKFFDDDKFYESFEISLGKLLKHTQERRAFLRQE